MVLRVVFGADGGGTKTDCAVGRLDGTIVGFARVGPSNHLRLAGGAAEAARNVREGLERALADAGFGGGRADGRVRAAFLALGGIGAENAHGQMLRAAQEAIDADEVVLDNDAMAGLASGVGECFGVVVIAGTGSIALAVDRQGRRSRSGGWGYRIGDEGSGQWIGTMGLVAAARAHDGRGPDTSLCDKVLKRYGISSVDQLRAVLYAPAADNRIVADFCPDVVAAAEEGDEVARRVVQEAGRELALAAYAAAKQLGLESVECPVVTAGGVFKAGDAVARPFMEELARLMPSARVVVPRVPPVVGAVALALMRAGVDAAHPDVQANLARSWEEVMVRHGLVS